MAARAGLGPVRGEALVVEQQASELDARCRRRIGRRRQRQWEACRERGREDEDRGREDHHFCSGVSFPNSAPTCFWTTSRCSTHFANASSCCPSTPPGSARRCSSQLFIASNSRFARARSPPLNRTMYAALASSILFTPR